MTVLPDGARRRVRAGARAQALEFLADPVAQAMVADGRLIASEVSSQKESTAAELELFHPLVEFPGYCWEWPPAMWLSAAELTLDMADELLGGNGSGQWMMKDAAPHNVLFRGVRPVFVDVLSFERWDGRRSVWPAYGQFVRTFLLPVFAHGRLGWPLGATQLRRDGYEPEEIYRALGWIGRLRPSALRAVTLPKLLGRFASASRKEPHRANVVNMDGEVAECRTVHTAQADEEVARAVLRSTLKGLRQQMGQMVPATRRSRWSDYEQTSSHYSSEDREAKQTFVDRVLAVERPAWVLDVGANTGTYSMMAALAGAEVVAIDADVQVVDQLARDAAISGGAAASILPLCVDLAQPTPAVGWENEESLSFLDRASPDGRGKFDLVMMLAVLHHLLLTSQIPLAKVAEMCARLTTRGLLIEWIPPDDAMFRELARGRDALYAGITEEAFRRALGVCFEFREEKRLSNGRLLIYLRRRG